jgi:hypothetical protein
MEFECDANGAVVETLGTDEYESLALVGVRSTVQLVRGNDGVTVVVERPADEPYPDLADRIARALAERTGHRRAVEVKFVERNAPRP